MHITNLLPKMVLLSSLLLSQVAFAQEQQVHTAHQSMTESEDHQMDHSKMQHEMHNMDHSSMQQMAMPSSSKAEPSKKESRDTQKKQANTEQQGDQHAQH
ncbi:hypothetical protein ACUM6W_15920 [Acinetobacter tandoii]|jgi:uncharacterized membrane protein|uniref:hypothetical protein n=1 Tax=Acinetobacter tandoii TaxID=202954 RepID=UPI00404636CE